MHHARFSFGVTVGSLTLIKLDCFISGEDLPLGCVVNKKKRRTKLEEGLGDVWFLSHLNSDCLCKASQKLLYFVMSHAVCSIIESTCNIIIF